MSEPRDPLIEAIRAAGELPSPPGRDVAFARAMRSILMPSRRKLGKSVIALFAAAILAVPGAVFAARETHPRAARVTPIVSERPDPGSSIHPEVDDATLSKMTGTARTSGENQRLPVTEDHGGSISTEIDETNEPSGDASARSPRNTEDQPTISPTPEPTGSPEAGDGSTASTGNLTDGAQGNH